jgi:hypothetical protein
MIVSEGLRIYLYLPYESSELPLGKLLVIVNSLDYL